MQRVIPNFLAPEAVLRGYVHAKDENRPHLLVHVFAPEAELVIINSSANISFPAATRGRKEIGEVLVSTFGASYENVYSFYMSRPPALSKQFTCDWLVAMSEKSSGHVRVGCGSYQWEFQPQASGLARRLTIAIEAMQILPVTAFERVFAWLGALDYPWSTPQSALRGMRPSRCFLRSRSTSAGVAPSPDFLREFAKGRRTSMTQTRIVVTRYGGPDVLRAVEDGCPEPKQMLGKGGVVGKIVLVPDKASLQPHAA